MEKFEKFEITNQELILGGKHYATKWSNDNGEGGADIYDSETHRLVYIEG